jgi:hypothetical protein
MTEKTTTASTDAWEAKRKIHLSRPASPEDGAALERTLGAVDGVLRVSASSSKGWVEVDYLQTKTDYQTLERVVAEAGFPAQTGWWPRLKSGWYQNLDATSRANAAIPASACCNKPPTKGH